MQSISIKGGVGGRVLVLGELMRDGLLLRKEGWEVVVIVNTTGYWPSAKILTYKKSVEKPIRIVCTIETSHSSMSNNTLPPTPPSALTVCFPSPLKWSQKKMVQKNCPKNSPLYILPYALFHVYLGTIHLHDQSPTTTPTSIKSFHVTVNRMDPFTKLQRVFLVTVRSEFVENDMKRV